MTYEARRNDDVDEDLEKQRNDANNARNVRNAADVAIASGNPYAVAAGAAVKGADKITGGRSTEMLGKGLTQANKMAPGGRHVQDMSNHLSESGMSDQIGKAAAVKNQVSGKGGENATKGGADSLPDAEALKKGGGGEQSSSLPSSRSSQVPSEFGRSSSFDEDDKDKDDKKDSESESEKSSFRVSTMVKVALLTVLPFILFVLLLVVILIGVSGIFSDYEDAFGISQTVGEETGNLYFEATSQEQQDFFDRINNVKLSYQAQGKTIDPLKIVAVYHILNLNGADLEYKDMTESVIRQFADAMFRGNSYDAEVFRQNLIQTIIPNYLPRSTKLEREQMADDVFDYIERYYSLIGKEPEAYCSASGECTYDIKGYYLKGKGNVSEANQISNLYVRLMQCGVGNGHDYGGVFGQPLEGEALVPFEKYILGVAYAEIGDSAPSEAIKAQMVAARSFILARHADMGGWRTLKQENGRWVLQVAACTQDQVYCDPDQGCSGTNGQWGQVYSGTSHANGFSLPALSDASPLRTYASATQGEVLVNSQGYIVSTGYLESEQTKFKKLANSGLNYKQILLQVYNQGSRNYGATDIQKASCDVSTGSCVSTGEYANWKQYEGEWISTPMGNSGKTIQQIGCLVTSVSMLIAKSGVPTNITNFNPGTFVEFLNQHGGFINGGNFVWSAATLAAPSFHYEGSIYLLGMSKSEKFNTIKNLVSQPGVYAVVEVKGNTGQHWVAIDSINGDVINMMDPGSTATDMWAQYNWSNTSMISYYRVG